MKKIGVVLDGRLLHIGEWDYALRAPLDDDGEEIQGAEKLVTNPYPEGAVTGEYDVVESADGRLVLASDHAALRAAEYPSIGDQLDALFKAGAFPPEMADRIAAVKSRHPKSA